MNRYLKIAREIIAKPRVMTITNELDPYVWDIKKIRDQLRKEILEEFDKTFKEDK